MSSKIKQLIPILDWLPKYQKSYLKGDIVAGITVGIMLIPQGMAYALLAGLPPIYGLYAGIVPLFLYAFFGTSRQLSVGPTALVSLLIISGVGAIAEPNTDLYISLVITTAFMAGVIQLVLGLIRGGFLINFLSHPVISGFTSAAAVIIALSQLKNITGINIPRTNKIHEILGYFFQNLSDINYITLALGLGGIALILLIKRFTKSIPAALVAVIVGILLVNFFQSVFSDIKVVGTIPQNLPAFIIPDLSLETMQKMLPVALTICIISFIESLAIAKTIESKHKNYRVIPNQELLALGITKVGGAFFQSYPTTGSFTRSAINDDAGAKTGVSSIVAAVVISLTLLFLTPLFYHLPQAILASIIVLAVRKLIDIKEAVMLWKKDKRDFASLIVTFLATLILGIQIGVLVGVLVSIGIILYRSSIPHYAVLGRLPETNSYRNIKRYQEAIQREDIIIFRFDAQLYFANATTFRETIESIVLDREVEKINLFVLDASSIIDMDSSGIHELEDVITLLEKNEIVLYLSGVRGPVRDIFEKFGLIERIGQKNFFFNTHDAVAYFTTDDEAAEKYWSQKVLQTNVKSKN
ncbi:MAG: solute carrier family 26 protein [Bacteroidota bacterium]